MSKTDTEIKKNGSKAGIDEMIDLSDLLARISDSLITFDTVEPSEDITSDTVESPTSNGDGAAGIQVPGTDTGILRYLIVTAANKAYGLATDHVEEVLIEPTITPVPGLPDWVQGVTNVHGDVASVVHLGRFLGGSSTAWDRKQPIILAHAGNQRVGLLVDTVRTIHTFPAEDIFSPPFKISTDLVPYLQGVIRKDDVIYLLDCEGLLTGEAMQQFS